MSDKNTYADIQLMLAEANKNLATFIEVVAVEIQYAPHRAKLYKASYDALVKEGFTPQQAIDIIKVKGATL